MRVCLVILALLGTSVTAAQVRVDVYYETLCPDSISFLLRKLIPSYDAVKNLTDLHLYPFGKAEIYEFKDGFNFYCQHGPKECRGNMIHACVLDMVPNFDVTLPFIDCMQTDLYGRRKPNVDAVAKKCAELTKLNWEQIDTCASGQRGRQLHREAGRRTKQVRPKIIFIPTVVLNEKYNEVDQNKALYGNFTKLILSKQQPTGL